MKADVWIRKTTGVQREVGGISGLDGVSRNQSLTEEFVFGQASSPTNIKLDYMWSQSNIVGRTLFFSEADGWMDRVIMGW